jgi:PAS domain S-box-containing protein
VAARAWSERGWQSLEVLLYFRVPRPLRHWYANLLVVLVCLGATASIFYWVRRDARHHLEEEFRSDAGVQAAVLGDACERRLSELEGLGRFYAGCEKVQPYEVDVFLGPVTPGAGGIRARAWVGRNERPATPSFRVEQAIPRLGNESLIGFEPESEPACRAAMSRATATGHQAASEAFLLPFDSDGRASICVFQPVYRVDVVATRAARTPPLAGTTGETRSRQDQIPRPRLEGFVLLVFYPDVLVASALAPLSARDLVVVLDDLDASEARRTLTVAGIATTEQARAALRDAAHDELLLERDLEFGGRHWTLRIGPLPGFLAAHTPPGTGWVPALGLLFTFVVGTYLEALRAQRAQERWLVQTRTGELATSEAKLRAITGSARDAIVMMDAAGLVSFWNPAAEAIFGWTTNEVLGQPLHDIIATPPMRTRFLEAHPGFLATGTGAAVGRTLELPARCRDGTEITVDLSISAVQLDGRWHAVGILRDITERVRVRDELDRAHQQAEAMNCDLEAAIGRANEMAVRAELANATKSAFLANMSHEIRTPMNGVVGMTGLLLDTELTPDQRDCVETVRSCGESLLTVINDILDFSKIEAGRLELEVLDFDLRGTLEDMADLLAVRAHEKGLEFLCRVEPEVPALLRGDPGRLRQVLTNLVGNAIKFTTAGEVCLRAYLEAEEAGSAKLRFEVRDTGIGIPTDRLRELFRPFTQVDSSTTRRFGGTGLGLSISKRLVEMMGGTIGVTSEDRQGSTFWFTAAFPRQAATGPSGWEPVADLRGRRVLVVEDNPTSRRLLTDLLRSWGCDQAEVADAPSALEALRDAATAGRPFEIAVLDRLLGEIDGEVLGGEIRHDPTLVATRLVLLTSIGERGEAKRFHEAGFAAYLTKPIKQRQFYQCLRSLLGIQASGTGTEPTPLITKHTLSEAWKRGVRILVADDNAVNQRVALRILDKLGYRADAVGDGRQVIRALTTTPYDLVLMDCQMPEMDGYEATRMIRDPSSPVQDHAVPVLAMTAHAMDGDQDRCLNSGMNDYVPKPVTPQQLASAIERWIGEKTLSPAGESTMESGERPPEALAA